MNKFKKKLVLHEIFEATIFLKGVEGVLEIISGAILTYAVKTQSLMQIILKITQHERLQDPGDFLANKLVELTKNLIPKAELEMWYLLTHGVIKIFLATMLMRGKIWAYPVGIYIFSTLSILLLVEFFRSGSMIYLVLATLEILVVIFTVIDYRMVLAKSKVKIKDKN